MSIYKGQINVSTITKVSSALKIALFVLRLVVQQQFILGFYKATVIACHILQDEETCRKVIYLRLKYPRPFENS